MTPRGYGPSASFCPRCAARLPGPAPTVCDGCGYQLFVNARPTAGLVIVDRPLVPGPRLVGAARSHQATERGVERGPGWAERGPAGVALLSGDRPSGDSASGDSASGAGTEPEGPRFLAVRRAVEPMIGHWELPGGFCDGWEHPAEAAVREAREELGVDLTVSDHLGMYVGSYEFQGELLPVLDVFFLATIGDQLIVLNRDEVTELAWFPLLAPPPLAFATMDAAVRDAMRRLGH